MSIPVDVEQDAPVHVSVRRLLRDRIGREWRVGSQLPPVSELARHLGVGQNNAHRAVRDLVAEGLLLTRRGLGTFVRQLPPAPVAAGDDAPAGPRHETTEFAPRERGASVRGLSIALAHHRDEPVPFVRRMMDGFRAEVEAAGAKTRPLALPLDADEVSVGPNDWGMVLFNPSVAVRVPPGKHHLVVVSTADHGSPQLLSRFDSVGVDQFQGGALAGRALREVGCDDACFIGHRLRNGTSRMDLTSTLRLHGFEQAWGEALADNRLHLAAGYSLPAGARAVSWYLRLKPRPQGVFCASDDLAIGFVEEAVRHGLKPGADFQVIGFDGQDRPAEGESQFVLTTVRVPASQMGRRAAGLMLKRLADPGRAVQRVLLPCSLSRGDTTAARR